MAHRLPETFNLVKSKLEIALNTIFAYASSNFYSLNPLSGLCVLRGDNILESCYQFVIKDNEAKKIMVVKFYDKIMDLISREGSHMVGSRINAIVGSKR